MPFGLTIGTDRAAALQKAIEDELIVRGYSAEADAVMAEYITIMIINNKSKESITKELEDVIGSDYDASFTDWLFEQAAKGSSESEAVPQQEATIPQANVAEPGPSRDTQNEPSRRPIGQARSGVYQQALSQAIPSTAGNKRTASARSQSPSGHPSKSRRTDIPTGPRAMQREGGPQPGSNPRSLLDRMGGRAPGRSDHDEIQSRIDNITQNPTPEMMMNGAYPGMDMNAMAAQMGNPMMLQEMMMNQMALMAQMANSMGILNGAGFVGPGFPQQGVPGDMSMFPNGQQQPQGQGGPNAGRGRGAGRGGRGNNRGRGGGVPGSSKQAENSQEPVAPVASPAIVAPTPITPTASTPTTQRLSFPVPERPQSPTLCKFGLKCTNAQCRYAHPSPVATPESGVVLSNEPCEKGKDCQDKDCVKGHVSPAVLKPQAEQPVIIQPTPPAQAAVPCRFGNGCTRPGCPFAHPHRPSPAQNNHYGQQCRFGTACTKATCPFQHPEGRILPGSFHRGLATSGPIVNVPTPETGSMGSTASPHRSLKFTGNATTTKGSGLSIKEQMQQQLAELEARKKEAEQAVKTAEAAAASKKEGAALAA